RVRFAERQRFYHSHNNNNIQIPYSILSCINKIIENLPKQTEDFLLRQNNLRLKRNRFDEAEATESLRLLTMELCRYPRSTIAHQDLRSIRCSRTSSYPSCSWRSGR